MSTLKELSRAGVKKKAKRRKLTSRAENLPNSQATYLSKLYSVLKSIVLKDRGRAYAKPSQITCFIRLADILEKNSITDHAGFFLSQFNYWGKDIYPGYLISKQALTIYWRYRECQTAKEVEGPKSFKNEEDALAALCSVRRESEQEVLTALKGTGVFSDDFMRQKEDSWNTNVKS